MTTKEEFLEALFQKDAEADDAPEVIKNLLKKANENNIPPLAYITETGPEIREILNRMLAAEARWQMKERGLTQ